jgi:putative endonuclease
MYFVYVIRSIHTGRLYKGHCKNLKNRLAQHNAGKTFSTRPFIPWEVVYFEEFSDLNAVVKREKYFKTAAGRRFIADKI